MSISSEPQSPVLADSQARLCLVLNALILPGLGTYRCGARLRGMVEMTLALGGCFWLLRSLLVVGGDFLEDGEILRAFKAHAGGLFLGLGVATLAWLSGILFSWSLWRNERARLGWVP